MAGAGDAAVEVDSPQSRTDVRWHRRTVIRPTSYSRSTCVDAQMFGSRMLSRWQWISSHRCQRPSMGPLLAVSRPRRAIRSFERSRARRRSASDGRARRRCHSTVVLQPRNIIQDRPGPRHQQKSSRSSKHGPPPGYELRKSRSVITRRISLRARASEQASAGLAHPVGPGSPNRRAAAVERSCPLRSSQPTSPSRCS